MELRYLDGVTTLSYDESKCKGCGRCTEVCPRRVFSLVEKRAVILDRDACIECGACMKNCPFGAVHVDSGAGCAQLIISSREKDKKSSACGDPKDGCCC